MTHAVEISRHKAAIVDAAAVWLLAVEAITNFDGGDLRNGIEFVGGYQA